MQTRRSFNLSIQLNLYFIKQLNADISVSMGSKGCHMVQLEEDIIKM